METTTQPICDGHEAEPEMLRAEFTGLDIEVSRPIQAATRFNEQLDLCGEQGENAYDTLTRQLTNALTEVAELRNHTHKWHNEGFCEMCGADGNA